jgi:Holliday junction resolvase RusA-like endonuclease
MITLVLPFPPSVNRLWRTTKGGGMYRSKQYSEWRTRAMWQISAQARGRHVSGTYKLTIHAVRPDKRKRDLGNLEKAVSDILVSQNIVEDDSLCEWIEARWVASGPECKITIEALGNTNDRTSEGDSEAP